jgi:hypothetical protein
LTRSSGSRRALAQLRVDLLEQPVRESDGDQLRGLELPVPVCADEPANTVDDLPRLVDCYDFVNIKLDKSGGFTAALDFAHAARAAGLRLMVGCMVGRIAGDGTGDGAGTAVRGRRPGWTVAAGGGLAGGDRLCGGWSNEPAFAQALGLARSRAKARPTAH